MTSSEQRLLAVAAEWELVKSKPSLSQHYGKTYAMWVQRFNKAGLRTPIRKNKPMRFYARNGITFTRAEYQAEWRKHNPDINKKYCKDYYTRKRDKHCTTSFRKEKKPINSNECITIKSDKEQCFMNDW